MSTSSNPKHAAGMKKAPLHLWPATASIYGSLALQDGAYKYGRNNMIAGDGVVASIYVAACKRHLDLWMAGQDNATDSGVPHLGHALACLAILVNCGAHGKLIDDRDYGGPEALEAVLAEAERVLAEMAQRYAANPPRPTHYDIRGAHAPGDE